MVSLHGRVRRHEAAGSGQKKERMGRWGETEIGRRTETEGRK